MINIPVNLVLEKLKEHGLSDDDIEQRIKQKMDQLSGLISREGAAHIIANELGIKLLEKTSGRFKVKDALPGMRNIEAVGKVTAVFDIKEFQRSDGSPSKVGSFIIGDETGTIRVTCWGDLADHVTKITKDNVIKITSAYVRDNRGRKEFHLNEHSKLFINPSGESIGDISFEDREFTRMKIEGLNENMVNAELLGTVVGVDSLRFYEVCPQCGKRARVKREDFACEIHGDIKPDLSYVMNLTLDDGSSSIRVVCFREIVEKCLNLDKSTLLALRDNPDLNNIKNNLLGMIIKVKGRSKKNKMFDRLEFTCQEIDLKPDPYEEIEVLDKELEQVKQVPSIDQI